MSSLIKHLLTNIPQNLVFVHPDVSVKQCAELMVANKIGALPVMDDDNLIGIVSERDITRNCVFYGLDPAQICALDVAYANVTILNLDNTISDASQAMTETRRRHVLVADKDDKIIAIVSIGDILKQQLTACSNTIEHLEHYIKS